VDTVYPPNNHIVQVAATQVPAVTVIQVVNLRVMDTLEVVTKVIPMEAVKVIPVEVVKDIPVEAVKDILVVKDIPEVKDIHRVAVAASCHQFQHYSSKRKLVLDTDGNDFLIQQCK
jgi:hypothetical protein